MCIRDRRYSVAPAVYPTALLEAAASMKLIHEHAKEWHVDTDKIVVQGSSAVSYTHLDVYKRQESDCTR